MVGDKGKKQKTELDDENNGTPIDGELLLSIEKLQEIQDELEKINEEANEKFISHPALGELLTEEDQKIFKYLNNLEVEDSIDVKSGYSITFTFNPNPYFDDTKLSKTFTFFEGVTKITATSINWKEGMGIPNGVTEDKKGKKRAHAVESFFTWYSDSEHEGNVFEIDDEVADVIKDDLWPNPLSYFGNDSSDEDELQMDEDDEENVGDESEDDDDEDDD